MWKIFFVEINISKITHNLLLGGQWHQPIKIITHWQMATGVPSVYPPGSKTHSEIASEDLHFTDLRLS